MSDDTYPADEGFIWATSRVNETEGDRIAAAKAQGAAEERAATVKLARELCEILRRELTEHGRSPLDRTQLAAAESAVRLFADALEAGDHIKQETKPNE